MAYDIVPPLPYGGWDVYQADYHAFFDQYEGPIEVEQRDLTVTAGRTLGYSYGLERLSVILK